LHLGSETVRVILLGVGLILAIPLPLAAQPKEAAEFRAVWIATVANIDWPSKKGLPVDQQKAELIKQFETFEQLHFNAVILQIRPMCDALYKSELEPWSEFLTGVAGQDPGYDPLTFAVQEAHKRKLQLHVWFNPYRAWHPSARSEVPSNHLVKKRPDLAKQYGKHHWLNPTNPAVQKHSLAVMLDVLNRYDIDGIHMDDYFYPYPENDGQGKEIPFPDDDTWATYQQNNGQLSRDDWRRQAVNDFVKTLYTQVKQAKPQVLVGISPFGIWRPGHPSGITGFDQYGKLYADARLWLKEGWVDYYTPQLYWPIAQEKQSYPKLLKWWAEQNDQKRHLWPGLYTSKHGAEEIANQVKWTRESGYGTGNVHFSAKAIMNNKDGIADQLKILYKHPAKVPESPWLKGR
jgi:uncharacterized lipoprotein YddW (UPF0748 family)